MDIEALSIFSSRASRITPSAWTEWSRCCDKRRHDRRQVRHCSDGFRQVGKSGCKKIDVGMSVNEPSDCGAHPLYQEIW